MACARTQRKKTPVDQRTSLIKLVGLDPVSDGQLPEPQGLHELVDALGRVCQASDATALAEISDASTWSDDSYTYFDMIIPGDEVDEIDLSVASGRLFLWIARTERLP